MKESDIRPREIPSPKDSVFLADMRSHQEPGKMLRELGTNFLGGVENDSTIVSLDAPTTATRDEQNLWFRGSSANQGQARTVDHVSDRTNV